MMIIHDNINGVGDNHLSRTHNPVSGAMRKSSPNLTAQTPRFRHKGRKMSFPNSTSEPPVTGQGDMITYSDPRTQGQRIPSPHHS